MQTLTDVTILRVITRRERLFEAVFGLQCLLERPVVSSMHANRDQRGNGEEK